MNDMTVSQNSDISTLVPVSVSDGEIGDVAVRTVDARDLHAYLKSKQHFSDWIRNRIDQYGFTQGIDFVAIHNSMTSPPSKDYTLTLDMAKELSMVERNAKGKEARQYFIECERRAHAPQRPQDYISALKELVTALEANAALEQDNALLNTIIDNEFGYTSILRASQHLGIHESAFNWRPLKKWTLGAGLEIKRVPSPRFQYQNLYPVAAFEHCYPQYDFSGLQPEAVAHRATKLLTGQPATAIH